MQGIFRSMIVLSGISIPISYWYLGHRKNRDYIYQSPHANNDMALHEPFLLRLFMKSVYS